MTKLKAERHHWWPESVSEFWKDADGNAHWLRPNGETLGAPPKNFGVITNGHHIKLGRNVGDVTLWDESFEAEFARADSEFPKVIEWLERLDRENRTNFLLLRDRFVDQEALDERISALVEGLVSLAVRSPMNREALVAVAEKFRGPVPARQRNALIGLNMRQRQQNIVKAIGSSGKFAVIYSPDREFIFGDGFFNNVAASPNLPLEPVILAPLTPRISVLFVKPLQYSIEPKLCTIVLREDETNIFNATIQIYANRQLFYRTQCPIIIDAYRQGKHLCYSNSGNPIDNLVHSLPGVPPRNDFLDRWLAQR